MIPAVLIAGTHSGVGKTTVTLGLMAALRTRGLSVQPFKVGPDFIDPTHHTAICGRVSRNLDTFMMGPEGVRQSFSRAVVGADVAVVEGVMGLFDGLGSGEEASTAHVAKALGIPVVLVVNAHGMSRSAAALIRGFSEFDPQIKLAGVILNRVGSHRHLKSLREVFLANLPGVPLLGAIPRRQEVALPSRHLGLQMGFEATHDLAALSALVEENCSVDALLSQTAPTAELWSKTTPSRPVVRIGVAKDAAFCFYYQDNLDWLAANGAELVFWSPLRDLLPDVDGLYLGGGYPELYAAELQDAPARRHVAKAAEDGMPIYGECGGLMYLCRDLEVDEKRYSMAGALPASTIMTGRLQALGYVEGCAAVQNPVVPMGSAFRGHEFHYSVTDCDHDARLVFRLRRGAGIREGWDGLMENNVLAGYLHAHFASFPAESLICQARAYRRS
ncbi:MAG: cobyrinic acid a,c-diamide synthase [Methanosaeta sp. PtaB.Bin039]|nr:MAG: cobyrinic acid a,c-diamide synthase [Methanosaeta sp. PtaB.Bin039]HOT07624.1 cobyrinate a,c-diamide synthase [Methanotrichaceae archaeon]HQF15672.1 cobyrinate a,c-diamide synthase [Methanotrichaceae archaeon]HQI90408.1 cobyrinate a,c-diamide synthase [Methanotrichaceae archaeon]HQJ28986.1 cobyrinate a,c-diamide synthase [Methanotrichaceae archaeon]